MGADPVMPASLGRFARAYWGEAGTAWAEALPGEVSQALSRWGLRPLRVLAGASTAYVAEVARPDGTVAVLKVAHPSILGEAAALRAYGGDGAVRCYADAGPALLVERCRPGRPLRDERDPERVIAVACALAERLWACAPPEKVPTLAAHCARLIGTGRAVLEGSPALGRTVLGDGLAALSELAARPCRATLLHGDLHPGNILSATRAPFLAIDPKPLVGDRAYDLIPLVCEADGAQRAAVGPAGLAERLRALAGRCEVEPGHLAAWGLARRSDWALFCHGRGDASGARRATREAERFARAGVLLTGR